jgi:hypothetical protein
MYELEDFWHDLPAANEHIVLVVWVDRYCGIV